MPPPLPPLPAGRQDHGPIHQNRAVNFLGIKMAPAHQSPAPAADRGYGESPRPKAPYHFTIRLGQTPGLGNYAASIFAAQGATVRYLAKAHRSCDDRTVQPRLQ